jgi:hypothetical protein
MIYLTGRNLGIGLHVIDIHCIMCEYESLSSVGFFHLIHEEKIDRNFGNMQHILEAYVCEFYSFFVGDLD